jgi:hypothetical protein
MTKVVYNACFGGFGMSEKAIERYWELKGESAPDPAPKDWWPVDVIRTDPFLVQVVEELGEDASGGWSDLQIRDVPTGSLYRIEEYDGWESVVLQDEYQWEIA